MKKVLFIIIGIVLVLFLLPGGIITASADSGNGYVTVTFDTNGGTGGSSAQMTPGDPLNPPEDPTREGYTFKGWLPAVPPSVPDENATYTALWGINIESISPGHIISYGSYPQTKVTDTALISALNSLTPDTENNVNYNGEKYKRVFFKLYTMRSYQNDDEDWPYSLPPYNATESFQNHNGYYANTVYWFKYEPVKWRVLSNTNGELFVLAEEILAAKQYNQAYGGVNWETCTLRSWLNSDFYNAAFSSAERSKIITSSIANAGSADTSDKLFLLSAEEATNTAYGFSSSPDEADTVRRAQGTDFSKSGGLTESIDTADSNSYWWLRSVTGCNNHVSHNGFIGSYYNSEVNYTYVGVRPAFKINLTASDLSIADYDANGGTGSLSAVSISGEQIVPPALTKTGYTLAGWLPAVPGTAQGGISTYTAQWAVDNTDPELAALIALAQAKKLPANAANDPEYIPGGYYHSGYNGYYPRHMFTPSSLAALETAVSLAQTGQTTVGESISAITAAVNNLVLADADYSELNAYISVMEGLNRDYFSAEDMAGIDELLVFAYDAVAAHYKKPVQESITVVMYLITNEVWNLPMDLTLIINTWNDFQTGHVQSNYTSESWNEVVDFYNNVLLTDFTYFYQDMILPIYYENLITYISALVLKDVTYTVKYQTLQGVSLLEDMTGYAKATDVITENALEIPGYTPEQASIQKTMTGIDAENVIVFTYTELSTKPSVTITKLSEGFKVSIFNWETDNKYQIWSYQSIISDLFNSETASQWILSKPYALGSAGTAEGDGSISFTIPDFVSPDSNYTIAVRITDAGGSYLGEIRDSYTPTDVSEVKIAKVLVDGEYSAGKEIREVKAGASMTFTVAGNNVPDTVFSAKVLEGGTVLTANSAVEFGWDISALTPGTYTVQFTATNGETTNTRSISVQLYSLDTGIVYGNISELALTAPGDNTLPKTLTIDPDFTNGSFYYSVAEPGKKAIFTSGLFQPADSIEYTFTKYGVYQVSGFVNREYEVKIGGYYDDGYIKQFTVSRSQTEPSTATLTATVNAEPVSLANPVVKGTAVKFEASAQIGGIGTTPVQYSFWRYDAKGYALVKDWSSDNTLDWTPARVGIYTIQVRAKGIDAGSYEAAQSVKVTVTDGTDQIAQGVVITINEAELNANAQARAPITIKANATSTNSEDLLYKFYVGDAAMGTGTLQNYSADSNCIWTPRKAGIYTISVLVKNTASFGAYDAMETFEITVR